MLTIERRTTGQRGRTPSFGVPLADWASDDGLTLRELIVLAVEAPTLEEVRFRDLREQRQIELETGTSAIRRSSRNCGREPVHAARAFVIAMSRQRAARY